MSNDDVLYRFRLRVLALAEEVGVRQACRMMQVDRSTLYRWRRQAELYGPELLRPRERRQPRMPNQASLVGKTASNPERLAAGSCLRSIPGTARLDNGVRRLVWCSPECLLTDAAQACTSWIS